MRLRSPYTLSTRPDELITTKSISSAITSNYEGIDFYIQTVKWWGPVPVLGQNLKPRSHEAGNAAYSLE